MSFTIASTVDEAVAAMAAGARPIAGGSDLVVGARQGKGSLPDDLVAIDRLAELASVDRRPAGVRIGALVTHARLMTDEIVLADATGVADAAALVGSPATRNVGTVGGNIMNGSPAMDTGAPLLTLGAEVELRSSGGSRTVPIGQLWTGPGATAAAVDELCVGIDIPPAPGRDGSAYVRLEYRRAMEIAVVGAAASVALADDGTVALARVALTAVAPTIIEVGGVSDLCDGRAPAACLGPVADAASAAATPISDLRATDEYRRHTVGVMARRAFDAAARRAAGESIPVPVNRALGIGEAL
ncbi:MAG: FAD binding domain-containing protein [Actinomycetota bacterium]